MTKNVKLEINNTGFVDIPCNETITLIFESEREMSCASI